MVLFCRPVKKTVVDRETGDEEESSYLVLKS